MAITTPVPGTVAAPATRLRSLTNEVVTVRTHDGVVTGTVLSCTRHSVWLVADDVDFVVALDEIVELVEHDHAQAA